METVIRERSLEQINDKDALSRAVDVAISQCAEAVDDYRRGKSAAAKAIVGRVMATTKGRANPRLVAELVALRLDEISKQ